MTMSSGAFTITSDKALLDPVAVHKWLSEESYWATNIPFDIVKTAFENSYTAGVLHDGQQVAYARFITDYATFAYLADVYVIAAYRGQGLSKQLIRFMLDQPWVDRLRKISLATLDAHGLYRQFGFGPVALPERLMERAGTIKYSDTQ